MQRGDLDMFFKRRKPIDINRFCMKSYNVRMKYVDAGGKESCSGVKCRNKCNEFDVCIKCCD